MMSEANPVTLQFTIASQELLKILPKLTKEKIDILQNMWLNRFGAWMMREEMEAFDQQKQPGGEVWPENTQEWQDFKASQGFTTITNVYTSEMKQSISMERTKETVSAGSPLPYSVYTQDRKDPNMNRSFIPDFDYAQRYAVELGNALARRLL